jgi:predicted GNAT family N-acyltransferase
MNQISEPLNSTHKKSNFSCGKEMLDVYIHNQANQDVKGYYTLSNNSIPSRFVPNQIQKKLPRSYESIPTTLLGRLAIDNRFQGQGIGKLILIDALKRSYEISKTIGSFAVIVDPIDQDAENFYEKYGFIKLPDSGKMFLPMKTISQLFK